MTALVILGIVVGLDNLRVGAALGTLGLTTTNRRWLAVGFGTFEALMPAVGLLLGEVLAARLAAMGAWLGAALLMAVGLAVLLSQSAHDRVDRVARQPWLLALLPLALSIDNLLAGVALGALSVPVMPGLLVVAGLSATLLLLGLRAGDMVNRKLTARRRVVSGVALLAVGAFALVA